MKSSLLVLFSIFIGTISVNAQKDFRGEIIYRLHANTREEKPDAELKIQFGDNKIKMQFKDKEEYDQEYLLVLFDSAAMYVINTEYKTFTKKYLVAASLKDQYQKRSFLGYNSTPVSQQTSILYDLLGRASGSSSVILYVADSLYYSISPTFFNNKELIVIQDNRIVLGAEVTLWNDHSQKRNEGMETLSPEHSIIVEAIRIRPMMINEEEFKIPLDFNNLDSMGITIEDTPTSDTTIVIYPEQKKVNKQPLKPTKPRSSQKSSAIKRKE